MLAHIAHFVILLAVLAAFHGASAGGKGHRTRQVRVGMKQRRRPCRSRPAAALPLPPMMGHSRDAGALLIGAAIPWVVGFQLQIGVAHFAAIGVVWGARCAAGRGEGRGQLVSCASCSAAWNRCHSTAACTACLRQTGGTHQRGSVHLAHEKSLMFVNRQALRRRRRQGGGPMSLAVGPVRGKQGDPAVQYRSRCTSSRRRRRCLGIRCIPLRRTARTERWS